MNKYLQAAVDRYPIDLKDNKIHPISDVDGQIIFEIIEIFKKIRFRNVVEILESYKFKSDDDIALSLLDVNTNIGKEKGENDNNLFIRYLNTCGRRLDLFLLISYDSIDLDIKDQGVKYCIRLNPTPEGVKSIPFYSNEILMYDTLEDRDRVLKSLDSYMELYRGIFLQ